MGGAAGMAMGGGIISGLMDMGNTAMQTRVNVREAHKQREWQESMRATAYQTAVKDLRKAGINPILAARFGGSSAPGGSAARAAGGSAGAAFAAGANAGTTAYRAAKEADLLESQTEATGKTGDRQAAAARLDNARAAKAEFEALGYSTAKDVATGIPGWLQGAYDKVMKEIQSRAGGAKGYTKKPTNAKKAKPLQERKSRYPERLQNWDFNDPNY